MSMQTPPAKKNNGEITERDLFGSIPKPLELDPFEGLDLQGLCLGVTKTPQFEDLEKTLSSVASWDGIDLSGLSLRRRGVVGHVAHEEEDLPPLDDHALDLGFLGKAQEKGTGVLGPRKKGLVKAREVEPVVRVALGKDEGEGKPPATSPITPVAPEPPGLTEEPLAPLRDADFFECVIEERPPQRVSRKGEGFLPPADHGEEREESLPAYDDILILDEPILPAEMLPLAPPPSEGAAQTEAPAPAPPQAEAQAPEVPETQEVGAPTSMATEPKAPDVEAQAPDAPPPGDPPPAPPAAPEPLPPVKQKAPPAASPLRDAMEPPTPPEDIDRTARSSDRLVLRAYDYAEIHRLREKIVDHLQRYKQKTVAFLGPRDCVGTTFLMSAVGFNAAYYTGMKVLLADLNMRRPSLHALFRMKLKGGFTELASGFIPWKDAIRKTGLMELSILTAGAPDNELSLSLTPEFLNRIVEEAKKEFDLVFFDTSPVLNMNKNNVDPIYLSSICDMSILVVQNKKTTRSDLTASIEAITRGEGMVSGVIYNHFD